MSTVNSSPGFLLINERLDPVAFNSAAVQILAYPTPADHVQQPLLFIRDRIRSRIFLPDGNGKVLPVKEYRSGVRTYVCRTYRCDCHTSDGDPIHIAVILERHSCFAKVLNETLEQFDLTPREMQTVMLLIEGLTSKEIATRMNISTNTVKAFLRLVMVKMNVSTRSGIVGKIVGPH